MPHTCSTPTLQWRKASPLEQLDTGIIHECAKVGQWSLEQCTRSGIEENEPLALGCSSTRGLAYSQGAREPRLKKVLL